MPALPESPNVLIFGSESESYRRELATAVPQLSVTAVKDETAFARALPAADILIAPRFPLAHLPQARSLRWFQCSNAGIDFMVPAKDRVGSIVVTNARGIHGEAMADYTIGMIVALHWDFPALFRDQQAKHWGSKYVSPLSSRTIGVIGLGAIGGVIAERAAAMGMTVLGVKRQPSPVSGVSRVYAPNQLAEVLPLCDYVVLIMPLTKETQGMIGARELAMVKPGCFLINIARGAVIDEPAMIAALQQGRLGGAALDVFATEPLPQDSLLWTMPKVIVTPHISGNPDEYQRRVIEIFAENLRRWRAGETLRNVVDLARGY